MPVRITQDFIRGLNTELSTIFSQELEANPPSPLYTAAVMETESTRKYVDYAWINSLGVAMREWIGEREVHEAYDMDSYLISNRKFELTVKVLIEDIEDGVYAFKSEMMARDRADAYQRRKNDMILDLAFSMFGGRYKPGDDTTIFQQGNDVLGPDGVPFFSDAHPRGDMLKRLRENGTETYKFEQTSNWSNITAASFSKDNLKAARTYLRKQKDRYGRPARINPNLLVVGPNNEDAAVEAVSGAQIIRIDTSGSVEERQQIVNPLAGYATVLVVDEFGDSDAWMLLDTSRVVKPFIFQNRVRPQFQQTGSVTANAAAGEVDSTAFHQDAILFGVRARMGAGLGNPILGFGSLGDDSSISGDALAGG